MNILKKGLLSLFALCICLGLALFLDLASSCAAPPQCPQEKEEPPVVLPLDENCSMTMKKFIDLASKTLNLSFLFNEAEIDGCNFQFSSSMQIPKSKFQGFFERLLLCHDYLCLKTGEGASAIFQIVKITPGRESRNSFLAINSSIFVNPEEVKDYADRGILITTHVPLKHIDARETLTSLNPFFTNQAMGSVRTVQKSNGLIITSFATKVHTMVKLIKIMDNDAGDYLLPIYTMNTELKERVAALEKKVAELEKK